MHCLPCRSIEHEVVVCKTKVAYVSAVNLLIKSESTCLRIIVSGGSNENVLSRLTVDFNHLGSCG